MSGDLKWYDTAWLDKYLTAKDLVASVAPARLSDFVRAFDVLRTDPGFTVKDVPGIFDGDRLRQIKAVVQSIPKTSIEMHEMKRFGRLVVHNNPTFTQLQAELTDTVSDQVGEEVEPRYNFLSLYTRLGICEPHLDAPLAKWTLDICIDQSEPWPIHFSQIVGWPEERPQLGDDWQIAIKSAPHLRFQSKVLTPGSGIIFSGSGQWHYRDALPAGSSKAFCDLLFFHYIPKGASALVTPRLWASLFDIPELADIPGIEEEC